MGKPGAGLPHPTPSSRKTPPQIHVPGWKYRFPYSSGAGAGPRGRPGSQRGRSCVPCAPDSPRTSADAPMPLLSLPLRLGTRGAALGWRLLRGAGRLAAFLFLCTWGGRVSTETRLSSDQKHIKDFLAQGRVWGGGGPRKTDRQGPCAGAGVCLSQTTGSATRG